MINLDYARALADLPRTPRPCPRHGPRMPWTIDGYYLYALDARRQALVVGVRTLSYRAAMIFGPGLLVTLADAGSGNHHFAEGRDQAGAQIAS